MIYYHVGIFSHGNDLAVRIRQARVHTLIYKYLLLLRKYKNLKLVSYFNKESGAWASYD